MFIIWMGGHYSEDKWIWDNGEDFTAYNDWGPSQPNATATVNNIRNVVNDVEQNQHHSGQGGTRQRSPGGMIIQLIFTHNKDTYEITSE